MKTLFGAIIVAGSGKIGGHVASKNRHGSYLRTKVSPSQPSSTYSANVRARLAAISTAWRALTQAQRSLWNSAVSDYKKTDVFGNMHNPSGFNLYQMLNNNLVNVGEAMISTPPTPESVVGLISLSATAVNAGAVTLTFADAIAADTSILVFATPAISAGKSFVKSEYRQIGVIDSAAVSPFVATALYNAKFGTVGEAGKKVFFRLVPVNENTGQAGQAIEASAIIS
jgi:hypothetical protein